MSQGFKKLACVALISLLALVIPAGYAADGDNPWEFLREFKHVRGAMTRIEERYMAALFRNAEKNLNALVVFPATCVGDRCSLDEPVAFSVFDARGLLVRFHEEPNDKALLQKIITSASAQFTAA